MICIVTNPVIRAARWITPRMIMDSHIPVVAFVLVLWIWLAIVFWVLPEMCGSGASTAPRCWTQARRLVGVAGLRHAEVHADVLGDLRVEAFHLRYSPHLLVLAKLEPRGRELVAGKGFRGCSRAASVSRSIASAKRPRWISDMPMPYQARSSVGSSSTARLRRAMASSWRSGFCRTKPRLNSIRVVGAKEDRVFQRATASL